MDYDGCTTLYHLNCGICGRTFWSHDASANVCEECKGVDVQAEYEGNCEECMPDCFEPWDVLWKAPDGTFKGRCDNCGFIHVFIEGHVTQYKFCPQCGEQKQEL